MKRSHIVFLTLLGCQAAWSLAAQGDGTLRSPLHLLPFGFATSAAPGDFDGDGQPDLACAHGYRLTAILRSGPGWEDWSPRPLAPFGEGVFNSRAGDFDGDGDDDLVALDPGTETYLLRSRGDGEFDAPVRLREAAGSRWAAVADFDRDGDLDLATANVNRRSYSVYLGGGNGSFLHRATTRLLEGGPHSVTAFDHDGDAALDLALGIPESGLLPLRGAGDGSFVPWRLIEDFGRENAVRHLVSGDLDGDRRDDLATSLGIALASGGDGTFRVVHRPELTIYIIFPLIDDFDGDARLDVAFSQRGTLTLSRGGGDGSFAPPHVTLMASRDPFYAASRDLDGDARADAIVADVDAGMLVLLRSVAGPEPFEIGSSFAGIAGASDLALLDLDVDGRQDLVLASESEATLHLHLDAAKAGDRAAPNVRLVMPVPLASLEAADLDGDGRAELTGASVDTTSVLLVKLDGLDAPPVVATLLPGDGATLALPALADGDGSLDLVVPRGARSELVVLPGRGDGTFDDARRLPTIPYPRRAAVADLDADGRADLVVAGGRDAAVHHGRDGGWEEALAIASSELGDQEDLALGDWDGDGRLDVFLLDRFEWRASVRLALGERRFAAPATLHEARDTNRMAVADLDGDGGPELLAVHGYSASIVVVRREAEGLQTRAVHYQAIGGAHRLRVADIDGDGAIDVAAAAPEGAAVALGRPAEPAPELFRRGDADGSGGVSLADPVVTLSWLFRSGAEPPCRDAADADDDGAIALTDAVSALRWLFQGGPASPAPGPLECGRDPTPDALPPCSGRCAL